MLFGFNWTILRPKPAFARNAATSNEVFLSSAIYMVPSPKVVVPEDNSDERTAGFRFGANRNLANIIDSTTESIPTIAAFLRQKSKESGLSLPFARTLPYLLN
jgi:hypothetical protein